MDINIVPKQIYKLHSNSNVQWTCNVNLAWHRYKCVCNPPSLIPPNPFYETIFIQTILKPLSPPNISLHCICTLSNFANSFQK